MDEVAALLCEAGLGMALPADLLFVEEEVDRTGFRHEMSRAGVVPGPGQGSTPKQKRS
jgi:hypothetical protein